MFSDIQCVLFDLDGTLMDSAPDLGMAADEMRTARGLPSLPLASYRAHAGSGARGMLGVAFGLTPDAPEFDALRTEFFANYARRLNQATQAFDGVPVLLERLAQRGLQWGVVTNKSQRFSLPLTAAWPMFAAAGTIVSGDSTPFTKPHPAPLQEAMRQIGVAARHCVYVGDDERDMLAAKAAGVGAIAARYGYLGPAADVRAWPADAVIDAPLELLTLLALA